MNRRVLPIGATCLVSATMLLSACTAPSGTPTQASPNATSTFAADVPAYYRDKGTLEVGVRSAAPYVVVKPNDEYSGLAIDIYEEVGRQLGLEVNYVQTSFDALVPGLQSKRIDMTAPMGDYKDRQDEVDFVDYAKSEVSALSLVERKLAIRTSSDLCGRTVAIEVGAATEKATKQIDADCTAAGKAALKVDAYPNKNAGVLAVQSQRADILLAPFAANAEVSNAQPDAFVSEPLSDALELPGGGAVYGIAVTKNSGLADVVVKVIQQMAADGTYDELFAKYGIEKAAIGHDQIKVNGVQENAK